MHGCTVDYIRPMDVKQRRAPIDNGVPVSLLVSRL